MKSKKVLIIDDDFGILDSMKLILEDSGFIVKAMNKTDAVGETVKEFNPDIVFLDLLLSGKDGKEICKELKSNPQTSAIPIIMTSAHPSAKGSADEVRANGFLPKPFDSENLFRLIKRHAR